MNEDCYGNDKYKTTGNQKSGESIWEWISLLGNPFNIFAIYYLMQGKR